MSENLQATYESKSEFFSVTVLNGVSVKTPKGEMTGKMVFIPDAAMKPLKERIVEEGPDAGTVIPSKGTRCAVGSKNGDNWGMAFAGNIGLQLTLMELNDVKKRENIF